jgi:hypothetical protein
MLICRIWLFFWYRIICAVAVFLLLYYLARINVIWTWLIIWYHITGRLGTVIASISSIKVCYGFWIPASSVEVRFGTGVSGSRHWRRNGRERWPSRLSRGDQRRHSWG